MYSLPVSKLARPRTIQTDNVARVDQTVTFTQRNRCDELFTLSYGTLNPNGYVDATASHDNAASPQQLSDYELKPLRYSYCLGPKPQEEPAPRYTLSTDICDGFGAGNRNWHLHLTKPSEKRHYWRVRLTLDLRQSVEATPSYRVTAVPALYFYADEQEHGDLCKRRASAGGFAITDPRHASGSLVVGLAGLVRWSAGRRLGRRAHMTGGRQGAAHQARTGRVGDLRLRFPALAREHGA